MVSSNFKNESIVDFASKYDLNLDSKLGKNEKIKLCSSDDFSNVINEINDKYSGKEAPVIIGNVGGFYVMATLAGLTSEICKSKPNILFFDRKEGNIKNAIYNTLLMKSCDNIEEYLVSLFGLSDSDIIKALKPKLYIKYIENVIGDNDDVNSLSKTEKLKLLKKLYNKNKDKLDKIIEKQYINKNDVKYILKNEFNLNKIINYSKKNEYNPSKHYNLLINKVSSKLDSNTYKLFKPLASDITKYLSYNNNYQDLLKYLSSDIKTNDGFHILTNPKVYNAYRKLITKKGTGYIKFVSDVDIATNKGIKTLNNILTNEGIITEEKTNDFPIGIAFVPHIGIMKNCYPFFKQNIENYVMLNKNKKNNQFLISSTATLDQRDFKSIGAEFIKNERKNRKPLKDLEPIEEKKGFPLISFIAGANYGNIYHSEVDTENMIDMAINNNVDTMYIQGLIYSTYYHNQTSRRLLTDPDYETLDLRLKAAKKVINRLNNAGIKVVYQMGDEEKHLYEDMFKIYVREQGVIGNDFLKREDLRTKFDWVRPIIITDLIPYMIRSGEDVTNFYTDESKVTRVSQLCHALKLYKEGLPLGDLAKYIKPEFLTDTDMFKVVYNTIDIYDEKDNSIAVNLMSNPNYSSNTEYAKATDGIIKNLKLYQTGAINKYSLEKIPQLFVDGRQGLMSIAYKGGGQVTLNVPQMINDGYYIENPELLAGIKEIIASDPTKKRVTQSQTKPNFPGGWMVTGDAREVMSIVPYYRRVKEVLEHVQKTGEALPELNVLHLNDTQIGSLTERIEYTLKMLDYAFYNYDIKGIWGNGDFQQGWNYPSYANESRHLANASTTSQMVDFVKLQRPWIQEAFGIIKKDIFDKQVGKKTSEKIIDHLAKNNLINTNCGIYKNVNSIKKNIDYTKIDLKLPNDLKKYEKVIREKLSNIKLLWFYSLAEGNHERNSDWNNKGYRLIEHLRQELDNLNSFSGSDVEVNLSEFFTNKNGDFVEGSYGSKTINGYNIIFGHNLNAKGNTPSLEMDKYLTRLGSISNRIDRAFMGHLHIFETSVINNKLLSITGCSAGQSGYEHRLGLASSPLFVVDRYLKDGRIVIDTIGTEFLKNYKIQNPYVKEKGLDNFIEECLTEYAPLFGPNDPNSIQPVHQRKLVYGGKPKTIGPVIK